MRTADAFPVVASLPLACVASVSNRVTTGKLEQEQKKKKVTPSPSPVLSFFLLSFQLSNSRGNACYAGYSPSEKFFGEREATTGNASAFRRLEVTKLKKKNENDKTHKQVRTAVMICVACVAAGPRTRLNPLYRRFRASATQAMICADLEKK